MGEIKYLDELLAKKKLKINKILIKILKNELNNFYN
jgi:hypothetical protein